MTRHLNYILILIPLTLGSLYLSFFRADYGTELESLKGEIQNLTHKSHTLKTITKLHGFDTLKTMEARQLAFKKNPKDSLKAWGLEHHVTLLEITPHRIAEENTVECAFTAPLDTDVYAFLKDLEKNYFKILSLGLYRDKILNTIQGRLILRPHKNK